MKKILVGSAAFFKGRDGYKGTDNFIQIIDHRDPHSSAWWSKRGDDTFVWVRHTKEELLKRLAASGVCKRAAAILVPELAAEFGITVEDISDMKHIFDHCEGKNAFYKTIADAYIANGSISLSDQQRTEAYNVYINARKNNGSN